MAGEVKEPNAKELRTIVTASAAGTAFEWDDFLVFGSLYGVIAQRFTAGLEETASIIFALLIFAAGFAVRPLGALIFGHIGDRVGRKGAFIITITLMGVATFAIGFLPTFDQAGILAPILLISLRLVQGLALGGEYGGAAIYVAEHSPAKKRGLMTGWIQASASVGLAGALIVVLITRTTIGEEAFLDWGWRVPFLLSAGLFAISVYMRVKLHESPAFLKVRAEGKLSKAPLAESFFKWQNLKIVLLALASLMAAQGVVWYTAHFYAQVFLQSTLKVDPVTVNRILIIVMIAATFLYVFWAWLSDHIGRKPIVAFGIGGAALSFFPGFHMLAEFANPDLVRANETSPVVVVADPDNCTVQFDPIGKTEFTTSCDIAHAALAQAGVGYKKEKGPAGAMALIRIGTAELESIDVSAEDAAGRKEIKADFQKRLRAALGAAGYPEKADPAKVNEGGIIAVMMWFVVLATALYGPQAATLVELFPTRIRYSALSLPYHVGTGWFGGFLPATVFAIVAATGDIYAGLWYPVIVATICVLFTIFVLPETRHRNIFGD